jgi:hypothetical protein
MRDLDLIRSYRDDVETDDAARAAARTRLRRHIEGTGRRLKWPARRLGLSLAILLVAASGATAASLVLSSDDVSLGAVACLDSTRTLGESGRSVFVEPSGDPVAACARVWRDGHLGSGTPPLVACVTAGQPIVVVPGGGGTCAELGLDPLPDGIAAPAAALGRAKGILMREWDLHRPRSECDSPDAVLDHSRTLLADAGVRGVSVELSGSGPCVGVPSFSEGGATVRIETVSRADAGYAYEHRLIAAALDPLSAGGDCQDPRRGAARARRLLAVAGLAHVRVSVADGGSLCLQPGVYEAAPGAVILYRMPR